MAGKVLDRWLCLRVRLKPGVAQIERHDGITWRTTLSLQQMPHPPTLDSNLQAIKQQFSSVFVPNDLDELIETALRQRSLGEPPAPQTPVPFPIFLEFPASFDGYCWDVWLRDLLVAHLMSRLPQTADLLQVVRLSHGKWIPREAPCLPLRLLAIGPASDSALQELSNKDWYVEDTVVQANGLSIKRATPFEVRDRLASGADLVVVDALHFPWLLLEIRRLPFVKRPRLVIALDVLQGGIPEPLAPTGVAQLRVPPLSPPMTQQIVTEFLYGIIHDQPLHEATKTSQRLQPPLPSPLRLTANPRTNQGLRISDALGVLADEIAQVPIADLEGLPQLLVQGGMTGRDAWGLVSNLREIVAPNDALIRQTIDLAQSMTVSFLHEMTGLQPMAKVKSKVVIASEAAAELRGAVHSLIQGSSHWTALCNAQERRVDIAMQQLEREVGDPLGYVRQNATLLPGRRYRVRVRIGRRSAESLMISEPPPLDPLLPAPEIPDGHRLQVVFFSNEFEVVGSAAKPLLLPVFGPSEAVFFELLTPKRNGSARLRIAVYHGNHLLQSFILNAWIGTRDESHSPLGFVLEFSRTAKFANIDELRPRALSIGVNSDSLAAATHSLHVKSDEAAYSVTLTEKLMADQVVAYRTLLSNATSDGYGNARFHTYPEPGTPIQQDFHEIMRGFAEFGSRLRNALFTRLGRAFRDRLRTLASGHDEVIQVVRFDPNFVFPWAVVYDFPLPTTLVGAPPPEVCPGVKLLAGGGVAPCGHTSDDEIYCVNGFWGVRHILEELISGDPVQVQDAITAITRSTKDRAVRFAVDEDEPHTVAMREKLRQSLGSGFAAVQPEETLLELLWQEEERPAVLIVLGHLEKKAVAGEPPGIRIVLPGGKNWLRAEDILERVKRKEWGQPCALVLLMGCETALTELDTLTDFVTALQSANAGGVVGTECVGFSRLLARFATEVTLALWQKAKLGQAVTEFRRRMLRAGNPLAFVFQAIGGADVHLALGGER